MNFMEGHRSLIVSSCKVIDKPVPYFGDVTKVPKVWSLFLNAYLAMEGFFARGRNCQALLTADSTFEEAPF